MAYINKTVSCYAILAKIAALKPSTSDWMAKTMEDIGWAIQGIGYHCNFIDKQTNYRELLEVKGHRVIIPCEVERIYAVEYFSKTAVTDSLNLLNPDGTNRELTEQEIKQYFRGSRLRLGSDISLAGLSDTNPRTTVIQPNGDYYIINGDYIVTSFESGFYLKLYYKAFATDKDGLPLIIDDHDYKEAVYWYCLSQLILQGSINLPNIDFKFAHEMWDSKRPLAANNVKMPSIDGMEKFKNGWLRYTSSINNYSNFNMHGEQPEYLDL